MVGTRGNRLRGVGHLQTHSPPSAGRSPRKHERRGNPPPETVDRKSLTFTLRGITARGITPVSKRRTVPGEPEETMYITRRRTDLEK